MIGEARENQYGWGALGDRETGRSQRQIGRPDRASYANVKGLGFVFFLFFFFLDVHEKRK